MNYPTTPDGRYFVVKGRLWRATDPSLKAADKQQLVNRLMDARRQVKQAKKHSDDAALRRARTAVNTAKIALGERGPVWWDDGAPDYNRHLVKNTPYASWYSQHS